MNLRIIVFLILFFMNTLSDFSLFGQGLFNQNTNINSVVADTVENQLKPYPVAEIVQSINHSFNQINKALNDRLSETDSIRIKSDIDTLQVEIELFINDSLTNNIANISLREIDGLRLSYNYLSTSIEKLSNDLMSRTYDINEHLSNLHYSERRWKFTLETFPEIEKSESIIGRIENTIGQIDSAERILQKNFEYLFNQQSRLSDEIATLELLDEKLTEKEKNVREILFKIDMPGLIKDLRSLNEKGLGKSHMVKIISIFRQDISIFRGRFIAGVLVLLVIFFFVYLLARWSKNHYKNIDTVTFSKFTRFGKVLIDSPFYTSLFLATLFIRLIYPELPQMIRVVNLLILMIPVIYFLLRMYYRYVRSILNSLLLIFAFTFLYELIFFPDIILRLVLLGYSVSGLVFFSIVFINKPLSGVINNKLLYGLWRALIFSFILFQITGITGNFIGAFSMAEFFTYAPIHTVILGITVFVTSKIAETLIPIILRSDILQELNVIREDSESIQKILIRWIKIFLWLLFIVLALRFFRIQEPVFAWGDNLLNNGWKIGAIEITPMRIITFLLIIWLSIIISRIISQILEKDIFERVKVSRGIPATITMVLKIVLITGGFFLAAAAAGMELTNLSIILGAFSVGIGFGLQNIFNNMVSGLILAFERPIKVGDTVQVDQLTGIVKKIGLRSSTVKSFDGAEVIVPNGNLISNQMVNWTLSDFSRRMDIRLGVAYGTDPEKVLEIMMQVAEDIEKVYKVPKPHAFFTGFGESSLDFRLLAWCNIDNRLETESQINIMINKKLAEAGIEIPFPQRDLHIRSDDTIKKTTMPVKTRKSSGGKPSSEK